HLALSGRKSCELTRHVNANWLERTLVAPLSINYHLAHHLYPNVPHYRLKALHSVLLDIPDYAAACDRVDSYLFGSNSLWRQLCARRTHCSLAALPSDEPRSRPVLSNHER
ncbi:MAG: fatty acid desaturase, partial [Casimicrobium sp.]